MRILGKLGRAYRATGADPPFGDPRRAHGVAMEGYYWRFSDPRSGRVAVALCGVNRTGAATWATVALAGHPGGLLRYADVEIAAADPAQLGATAGSGAFVADGERVRVDLGPDARLDVHIRAPDRWPRPAFGGLGMAHAVPGLGQYWHPHLLDARAEGSVVIGDASFRLDGFHVYGEKNWGAGGFPSHWWWGQAHGFTREDLCVAFAGGELTLGPLAMPATALVVRIGDQLVRLGHPASSPVRAEVEDGRWRLRGRSARWSVTLEADASPAEAHLLPVPLPAAGHSILGARQHLAGHLRITVRRRGRIVIQDESELAGLETGRVEQIAESSGVERSAGPSVT